MVETGYQVVDVLMLVGNVAPVALYFLALGLVNSHSRPYLTTSRSDFLALTIVLVPVLLWPLPRLAGSHFWWPLALGVVAAALMFYRMLPGIGSGFVVYNISEAACTRLLEEVLCDMRLAGFWDARHWRSNCGRVSIHLRRFALLRNVSISVETGEDVDPGLVAELGAQLERRLDRVTQLPSTMGACLVMLGACLLILPMWMVGRHIHDLVEAMSHLWG